MELEDLDDASEASLDDATGEDEPADTEELELDESDTGWLEEPNETPDLDLGDVAITDFGNGDSASDDAEELETSRRLVRRHRLRGLDGGDEGPLDADEELREQDLPALDADEEGDLEDAALVDEGFAADEPLGLPWAAEPWERVGAPVAVVGARAVACAGPGAIVAGRNEAGEAQLVKVDLEGASQALGATGLAPARVEALAVEGTTVAAVDDDGTVFVSRDGGQTFLATPLATAGLHAAQIAIVDRALWIRTRAGALLFAPAVGELRREPVPGAVGALAGGVRAGEQATALALDAEGRPSALAVTRRAGSLSRETLDAPDVAQPGILAVRGAALAYAPRRGGIAVRDAGGKWKSMTWPGLVTALAFVGDGALALHQPRASATRNSATAQYGAAPMSPGRRRAAWAVYIYMAMSTVLDGLRRGTRRRVARWRLRRRRSRGPLTARRDLVKLVALDVGQARARRAHRSGPRAILGHEHEHLVQALGLQEASTGGRLDGRACDLRQDAHLLVVRARWHEKQEDDARRLPVGRVEVRSPSARSFSAMRRAWTALR